MTLPQMFGYSVIFSVKEVKEHRQHSIYICRTSIWWRVGEKCGSFNLHFVLTSFRMKHALQHGPVVLQEPLDENTLPPTIDPSVPMYHPADNKYSA